MKKNLTILVAMLLCISSLDAQYKMHVELNNGNSSDYWTSDVKKISWSYQLPDEDDKMHIELYDGNTANYLTSDIKSISWIEPICVAVDLGLSVKWATCNVGASKPEDYGSYFAWGETIQKSSYTWSTLKYCLDSYGKEFLKYVGSNEYGTYDNKKLIELSDDAAHVNWGGSWRMPTASEFDELQNNCTWTWTTQDGVKGYKITSKKPGYTDKSIFLPAAGYRNYGTLIKAGTYGDYWSSSLETENNNSSAAYELYFSPDNHYKNYAKRFYGHSVRPVIPCAINNVSINGQFFEIMQGGAETLTATILYENGATGNNVTWSSSDTSIAIVDQTGKATAVSVGTCTITASSGSLFATCSVTVIPFEPEYVDLGLSVKWATFNIGASKPEIYGEYFSWGETTSKSIHNWYNYKYCKGDYYSMTKYCTSSSHGTVDNKTTLELSDDAARANWGGKWRMPTITEFDELLNNCTWTWTTQNGINGYKVTSNKAGYTDKSIFLPAAGYRNDGNMYDAGSRSFYWSSSLYADYSPDAYYLYFDSDYHSRGEGSRCNGLAVRPVCPCEICGININKQTLEITQWNSETLTVEALYENGYVGPIENDVIWSSSDTGIATVDQTGNITAISAGTCTIKASKGTLTATCLLTVIPFEPEYVDLGLSIKWATCNVGATRPEDYGSYFAWGETTSKSTYDWSTYKYYLDSYGNKKYVSTVDNKTTLELSDDAANANWGGSWRMPTDAEFDELIDNCTWIWYGEGNTVFGGVAGYKVTSNKTGYTDKSIFLPAAGYRSNVNLYNAGSDGYYWSSSLSKYYSDYAYVLYFYSDNHSRDDYSRYVGQSVRPVYPGAITNVSLNRQSVVMMQSGTETLTATVQYENGRTDNNAIWLSSDTSIATVDQTGKITAVAVGTCTITASSGSLTATCSVTVIPFEPEYVDLGLSVKWATFNVGATKPEEYGDYFSWGETTSKSIHNWYNYKYCKGDYYSMTKYCTSSSHGTVDNKTTLELSDDAARANWGGNWRMPTAAEFDELIDNCTWIWYGEGNTVFGGVAGYKVTSNKTGYTDKSVFLPAAGYSVDGYLREAGSNGYYWSSSLRDDDYSESAYALYFYSDNHYESLGGRSYGSSVRPVCPSESYVFVTEVKLNTTSVSLEVGDTTTLTATVSPFNATDKSVTWKSSNTTVATVDSYGKVTAKSVGTATITVTTTDGCNTATCTVTVNADGKENGHDYVDLGLPSGLKWATCNVGATKPEDYGDYFAWGETVGDPYIEGKTSGYSKSFDWNTYKYCNGSYTTMTKYCTSSTYGTVDNKTTLELSDDAAHVNWGGKWRMPTATEIDELLINCTCEWTTQNGVNGYKVTGKKEGYTDKSIFLPAAGYRNLGNLLGAGSGGYYWYSSLSTTGSNYACGFFFLSVIHYRDNSNRYYGRSVRPVCP